MEQPDELICTKCNQVMALAKDTEGDLVSMRIICVCGHINHIEFIGYPKLWGTYETYFDFTDEYELTCHKR